MALAGLVLLNLLWGGSLPATKLALGPGGFGPFSLAAARLVLAAILFMLVLRRAALCRVPLADALRMAGLGVVGFAGVQVLQALGAGRTSGATGSVLASTGPVWIAVLAPVLLRERVRPATVGGVLVALVGVAVVTGPGQREPGVLSGAPLANLTVLLSSVAYALYTVLGRRLATRYSPLLFCGLSCLGGAAASLPFAIWELAGQPVWPTPLGWALLAYLGGFVTFVGFVVWFWGLRALNTAQAGALVFLQPLSGVVLAVLVLADRPTVAFVLGCGLILVGVYVAAGFSRPASSDAQRLLDCC